MLPPEDPRPQRPKTPKTIATLKHDADKRKNIPTAEHESVLKREDKESIRVAYERRNRDLDPQLVWPGKDERDWSDLVVHAPPLYIQEKVHPKVLIEDVMKRSKENEKAAEAQIDLFADFNGMAKDADKSDFYQHDQNWSNRIGLVGSSGVRRGEPLPGCSASEGEQGPNDGVWHEVAKRGGERVARDSVRRLPVSRNSRRMHGSRLGTILARAVRGRRRDKSRTNGIASKIAANGGGSHHRRTFAQR